MKAIRSLLRLFSYLFHALFIVVALVMGVITLLDEAQTVSFDLLPLAGKPLVYGLFALALIGIVVLLLAVRQKAQLVYVTWSIVVLVLVARFFLFSSYGYTPGTGGFNSALYILAAAILTVLGARQRAAPNSR